MEKTWASGALELLRHADSHCDLETAFDSRIAFISIDNSVETSVRVYLSLPRSISGLSISRREIQDADSSFPKMVALLFQHASAKLVGLDPNDIEHYHRIRNQLYHNGTGLAVDDRYLKTYREIANVLLRNLFGVSVTNVETHSSLGDLVLYWNEVQTLLKERFEEHGVDNVHTYKWEMAVKAGILDQAEIQELTELRMIRNSQVHSTANEIDKTRITLGIRLAQKLLKKLQART